MAEMDPLWLAPEETRDLGKLAAEGRSFRPVRRASPSQPRQNGERLHAPKPLGNAAPERRP